MSYRRGVTRLYIVAAAIWIMWGLYRPIPEYRQLALDLLKNADVRMADCYRLKSEAAMAGRGTADPDDRCGKVYGKEAGDAYAIMNRKPWEIWRGNIGSLAESCLLPPAGGAILLASLFWVAGGFRSKSGAS